VREDLRERGLAEARGAREKQVIQRLAAAARSFDGHAQILFVLGLPDVVVEGLRPQRAFEGRVLVRLNGIELSRGCFGAIRTGLLRHRAYFTPILVFVRRLGLCSFGLVVACGAFQTDSAESGVAFNACTVAFKP
jgi:hypothetical protein